MERMLTQQEVLRRVPWSMRTLERRRESGEIKSFRDQGRVLIPESEIERYQRALPTASGDTVTLADLGFE
jgi:Helix-turn-helix domain